MSEKSCNLCKHYQNVGGAYICKNQKSEKYNQQTQLFSVCDKFKRKNRHTTEELKYNQSLPLDVKINKTKLRVREWIDEFGENGAYISFSGGKDSTVLLDIVRQEFPNMAAVFVDTGLEYPSVRQFAMNKENVTVLKPKMNFREVLHQYGVRIG